MPVVFLSLGSNQGNRSGFLSDALRSIDDQFGRIIESSSIYETQAWGFEGSNFLNMAVTVGTTLSPEALLQAIKQLEKQFGREKGLQRYVDRVIDIDILFYGNQCIKTDELEIPHPLLHKRRFVMEPLCEKWPNFIHPVFNRSLQELSLECDDLGWIRLYTP